MARARNIKPSFFTNEQVSDNCPLGRLLFIGLWTMADYKGDLEWKEKTLKIQLLPWDECSLKELAINLDKSGLIRFYSDGNKIYINIPNFEKHQNPHKNERDKGSDIPHYSDDMRQAIDFKGLTINRDLSGLKRNDSQSDRADSLLLIPESPILIPEPVTPESQQVAAPQAAGDLLGDPDDSTPDDKKPVKPDYPEWFESLWSRYPGRAGSSDKRKAFQAAGARLKDGYTYEQLEQATDRYRVFCLATGKLNTEYVKQAATFYGPGGHIDNLWTVPGPGLGPNGPGKSAATLAFTPEQYDNGIGPDGSF